MPVRSLRAYDGEPGREIGPWPGLSLAAGDVVDHLLLLSRLDLWMVTHVQDDDQVVVAATGSWSRAITPGTVFSWQASFCRLMVESGKPAFVPDVQKSSRFRGVAVGALTRIKAYVGVPLLSGDGRLFGSLCAFSGQPQGQALMGVAEPVRLLGRMLSTVAAGEQIAADRSADAAAAYALAERDRLTELLNRRGWDGALAAEEQRSKRYGSSVSVVALDLDELKQLNDTRGHAAGDAALAICAATLRDTCRPGDTSARTGGDEFGLLAVECDAASARALQRPMRAALRTAGVSCSVGVATRRSGEGLVETWARADEAMYRAKRRRGVPRG